MTEIIIGGDVCPGGRNLEAFRRGDARALFNDLRDELAQADLTVLNLECPLIARPTPIQKYGPVLGAPDTGVSTFKHAGVELLNVANNHILDHGPTGLLNTLDACARAGLATVGAGRNRQEASQIRTFHLNGLRVGVLAMAEHEFSVTEPDAPGANPLDPIAFVRALRDWDARRDYLIVLVHAGLSDFPYPSPWLLDTCRFLVEMGARAVVCQHSHCPGVYERYRNGFIVYGQGNLLFDLNGRAGANWHRGFLVKLEIAAADRHALKLVPYVQSETRPGARKMAPEEAQKFLRALEQRSAGLTDPALLQQQWRRLCRERKRSYYAGLRLGGANRVLRYLDRKLGLSERLFTRKQLLVLENYLRCESHREVLEALMRERRLARDPNARLNGTE